MSEPPLHLVPADAPATGSEKGRSFKRRPRKPPPPPPPAVWIAVKTAAALLDMSPAALRKKIQRRDIPPELLRHIGASLRLNKQALLAWLSQPEVEL